MANKIIRDTDTGRLLWVISDSIVETLDRDGWHKGNYQANGSSCKDIKITVNRNQSFWTFTLIENDDSETIMGYIAKRK